MQLVGVKVAQFQVCHMENITSLVIGPWTCMQLYGYVSLGNQQDQNMTEQQINEIINMISKHCARYSEAMFCQVQQLYWIFKTKCKEFETGMIK